MTEASLRQQRHLLRLQQIDVEVRRLQHRRGNLPEQQALDEQTRLLDKLDADHLATRDELVAVDRRQRRLEHDVSALDSRRKAEEARMYSGSIVTEREVAALRSELASLKTRKRDLEDELLETMERNEELTSAVKTLEERRADLREEVAPLEQARDSAAAEIDAELAEQAAARDDVIAELTPGTVAAYDRLRARKDGVAIAELRDSTCQGCHIRLTAGELEEGHEIGELGLPRCVQCGRLLVEPAASD